MEKVICRGKLTFQKAFELQGYEAADKNAQQLTKIASAAVQRVTSGSGSLQSTTKRDSHACHRCGLTNYKANKWKFKEATCHAYGNKGHIKRAC